TLTVHTAGPSDAQGVQVSDPIPAGTTFVSADHGGTLSAGTVTWNLGTLAAGTADTTLHLVVHVDPSRTADLSNTATVGTSTSDPDHTNDSATEGTHVQTSADIEVQKSAPATATAGTDVTSTITATNHRPSDNAGFTVTDALAPGTTFVSASPGCANASGTVTCTSSGLALGGSTAWTITAHIASGYGDGSDLANTAQIRTNATSDSNPANDTSTTHTQVSRSADLAVTKTADPTAIAGTDTTFTISVKDNGPSDNAGYSLSDALPGGTSFVSASAACTESSGTVTLTRSRLSAGGPASAL